MSAAGLTVGATLLGGCATNSSTNTTTASERGHVTNGAPQYQDAMNRAKLIETAPDESEALAKFVVVSDVHLDESYEPYIERTRGMFEDIAEFCPDNDAIIVNGDITDNGTAEQYALFAELAEESGFSYPEDFVLVIGNHDQYDSSEGVDQVPNLTDLFREQAGISDQPHPYYDRTINGVHLIILGPDRYPEDFWDRFGISDEQIEWMDDMLDDDLDNGVLSFVFMHEPLYQTVRNTEPGDWGHEWSLSDEDNDNLHDCLKKHPNVIFFTGHTHALPDTVQLEGEEPLYVGTGSIAYCIDDVDDDSTGNADISEYGSSGWEVTIWETCIRFRMRDFLNRTYSELGGAIYQF